jgi:hypothetical protein
MSDDGLVVALGAPGYDDNSTADAGRVQVYAYENSVWTPRIYQGGDWPRISNQQISVVSLSRDGTILAMGGYGGGVVDGFVKMYRYRTDFVYGDGYFAIEQHTRDGDFGWSVALSGDGMTLAVGAPLNTGGGQVEVFEAVDSSNLPLSGRRVGSELEPIANSYQGSEYTVWGLLDLALVEIQALQARVSALENP